MYCHSCGGKAKEDSLFCEICGTKLNNIQPPVQQQVPPTQQTVPPVQQPVPLQQTVTPPAVTHYAPYTTPAYSTGATTPNAPSASKNKILFILLPICAVIIVALVAFIVYLMMNPSSNNNPDDLSNSTPRPEQPVATAPSDVNGSDGQDEDADDDLDHVPALLTVDEARDIAQRWLLNNPLEEPNILGAEYAEETYRGEEFFRFFHIEPWMYWFSILVSKETGELLCMLIEDGANPGPPVILPLDEWYENMNAIIPPTLELYQATVNRYDWFDIYIHWLNGETTIFVWDAVELKWIMHSRNGGTSDVLPTFTLNGETLEIRFPTTSRVYYLYPDFTGIFGDERLHWSYDLEWWRDGP